MTEAAVIAATSSPVTVASLAADLGALGVRPGMTLLVHSSLSVLGWVCGGPAAVVLALEQVLGPQGTLVMPTHSTDLTDPAAWRNPPVPAEWIEIIRANLPAYDPTLTPVRQMGAIVDCFRSQPGTVRSGHPYMSFAARGPHAAAITRGHALEAGLGEQSPLARVYDLEAWVLLLGVGHGNNTSLHLAEHRARLPGAARVRQGTAIVVDGQRQWVTVEELDVSADDFAELGAAFARDTGLEIQGPVGQRVPRAVARLMPQRALVDYAVGWLVAHR